MSVVVIVIVYVASVSIVNVYVLLLCVVCEFVMVRGGAVCCMSVVVIVI